VQFSELQKSYDLDLGSGHTAYHSASLIDLYLHSTYQISLKSEKLFVDGRTYVPTDGHFRSPLMVLGRLGGVDLINWYWPRTVIL